MGRSGALKGIAIIGMLGLLAGCAGKDMMDSGQQEPELTKALQQEAEVTPEADDVLAETITQPETESGAKDEVQPTPESSEAEKTETATVTYGKMPIIQIETENKSGVTDDEVYTNCTVSVENCEEAYVLTDAVAGIRLRGNSTQMNAKKPYRIKFEEKQQVLGLSEGAHKSWVLLAEANDPSLLRNMITYRLANALSGISYATDCAFVEVYLNGEYNGVYLLAEQTQVDNHRVAIDEEGVTDATKTDTGYLLELEADRSRRTEEGKEGEAWFAVTGYAKEENSGMHMMNRTWDEKAAYYVVKSDARSPEQMAFIQDYMIQVYDAVYKDKTKEAVEELVDLTSAVDMYLVQLIANDFDNNFSSMYLYKDAGGKLMFGAPWDYDLAYGGFGGYGQEEDTVYVYHLLRRLGEYDWFKELAAKRYAEISTGEESLIAQMKEDITKLSEQYAEEFDREYAKWRENQMGMGGFGGGFGGGAGGFGGFGDQENWEMPEGFGGFGNPGNRGDREMSEGIEDFGGIWNTSNRDDRELPEGTEGFGGFGNPGNWGDWEMSEGTEGFGGIWNPDNFGEWEMPEMPEMPEWDGNFGGFGDFGGGSGFGGFGGMGNFGFGAGYDTQKEAAEALLDWLEQRLTWVEGFLREKGEL